MTFDYQIKRMPPIWQDTNEPAAVNGVSAEHRSPSYAVPKRWVLHTFK